MAKESNCRGIAADTPTVLNDAGGTLLNGLTELTATIMAVDGLTDSIAGGDVCLGG
jgi:hypothetical protein